MRSTPGLTSAPDQTRLVDGRRIRLTTLAFIGGFSVIALKLASLAVFPPEGYGHVVRAAGEVGQPRPDILDRNGQVLATDIQVASLFADPRQVLDIEDSLDQLSLIFPDTDAPKLAKRLASKKSFVWLRRGLTPKQQADVHNLGLPGFGFISETRRVYPAGRTLSHLVGHVNIDNAGMSGIEKYIDDRDPLAHTGLSAPVRPAPVKLAVDIRVQHAMRDELIKSIEKFDAIAAAGIILDAKSGEVVAMVSLPDFDPHNPKEALIADRINRIGKGVFELGSMFKTYTTAMVLDEGKVDLNGGYDASAPIRVGRFRIRDFHGKNRYLSVPEIFIYSSNIGAAKMALDVGVEGHQEFLRKLGLLNRLITELPESARPLVPKPWRPVSSMTIAFGHGLGVTPLQAAAAGSALFNGGTLITPTFLQRTDEEADLLEKRVISESTSEAMRYLMRLNGIKGTGRRAQVKGYRVGGKTGTAEKAGPKGYQRNKLLNTFLATFPTDDPQYVVLILLDEPKGLKETFGHATAGWNVAPTVANIIRRVAPMLGVDSDEVREGYDAEFILAAN